MSTKRNINSEIRSALRRVWLYSELRKLAMGKARVSRGVYRCNACKKLFGPKMMDYDHVIKCTPHDGIRVPEDWGIFIKNLLFCGLEGIVGMCKPCHQVKTNLEKNESRTLKKKLKKHINKKIKKGSRRRV